jgi:hypothetical protein
MDTKNSSKRIKLKPKPQSKFHDVSTHIIEAADLRNLIATDLPGRYPITSARGHKYLFLMYDHDSNFINAIPIHSRKTPELIRAFKECYNELRDHGLTARLLKLDNEVSKDLIKVITDTGLEYQLVSPGDHRQNPAERAIQAFKSHFIATRSGTDSTFPQDCWDLLVPLALVTLNIMRPSRINPAISAYTQVKGTFDFNKTPLAPAGCKVIVHNRRMERASWADRGTDGFFIDQAPQHYRNYKCYIPATKGIRISNTVEFFPAHCDLPHASPQDKLSMILQDLMGVLTDPIPNSIFHPEATEIRQVVNTLQDIIGIPQSLTISKGAKPRHSTPETTTTMSTPLYLDGTIVRKKFLVNGTMIPYEGEIKSYDPINKWYHIVYKDGDTEDFTAAEVKRHRKQNQQYSRAPRVEPLDLIGGLPQSIPTISNQSNKVNKALSTQLHTALLAESPRVQPLNLIGGPPQRGNPSTKENQALHTALLAGAIWDPDLSKWMRYKDIINHPDPIIRQTWMKSGEDEFGRLFQGFGDVEGKHVLEFIHKSEIPAGYEATYARYTAAKRPEKEKPNRCRITAGGDRLEYHGNTTTHTASMETIKIHWNSTISTRTAKYCTMDCSNMYLESFLPTPQYVRFLKSLIPPKFYEQYGLDYYADGDYVYARIVRAWYGLKESGKIAHDDIVAHMAKHGYKETRTPGLFVHETRPISFTLVVDDFGIKYTNKNDVEHLKTSLEEIYTMKIDWEGKRYVGIDLKWDYEKREVLCSMDGYVEAALKEFKHTIPKQVHNGPSKVERPDYGAKIQYVQEDHTKPLTPEEITFIKQVTGKFLFYGRAIDITMRHVLNELAIASTNGTDATMAATKYFLDYAASNQDAVIRYQASDMILYVVSDAAYLVCPKARSRAGGYHYLGNKDGKLFNAAIFVLAKVIKNVMASASESEVGSLFMNGQEAISSRNCLIDMGHPQPATKMITDNNTAEGIIKGTIKQKRSKSIDMRFYWLKDRQEQGQFNICWEPGKTNLADYTTKHHPSSHHKRVRPIYLYMKDESPRTLQGCIEILSPNKTQFNARTAHTSPSTLKHQRSITKITFTSSTCPFRPNTIRMSSQPE